VETFCASELDAIKSQLIERLKQGQVAVFPTDTIYGFTADARNGAAVERILAMKQRRTPVSCIPHSFEWARSLVSADFKQLFDQNIDKYLGRYTTLWPSAKGPKVAHPLVQTDQLVGIRFPQHWIRELAADAGIPLTTTSVNRTGQNPMRSLETLDPALIDDIDFLVDEGPLDNPPSVIVRCDSDDFVERVRG
jgi:L-threonylcarbamoyladenylate synthase